MIKEKYTIKDFLPLILFFVLITIISVGWTIYFNLDFMRWMEIFMGLFFLVFGIFKVLNLKGFAEAYKMYDVIALREPRYGYVYPFLEIGLGVLFLTSIFLVFTNLATLILMTISALGVFLKLRKKEKIMCACLGVVFKIPMTWVTLVEDLLMVVMSLAMLIMIFN